MVLELVAEAVQESRRKMCSEIVEEILVDGCWEELEVIGLLRELEGGGTDRRNRMDESLKGLRELRIQ